MGKKEIGRGSEIKCLTIKTQTSDLHINVFITITLLAL